MKYKILSFVVGLIVGLLISFGYGKIFNSDSTTQMGNFGPMGGQFSGSGRFESGSGRLEGGPERGSGGTSFEDERQNILENEDGNETFSGIVEEPGFDRNSDND